MLRITLAAIITIIVVGTVCADVVLVKTPNNGIQPQAVADAKGNVHLLYFDGEPKAGNLKYVRRNRGQNAFATPIQVNSQDGSAIAVGTIRGGQIALGKNGRVHVAWNGSMKAEPKNPIAGHPMMYARPKDDGKGFEPQRNLMTHTYVLDGGGTLAADANGNVYVAWHALGKDSAKGEDNRKVWVAVSHDDGKTFAEEKVTWDANTGACGCCGMRAFADAKGYVSFLYRAISKKRGIFFFRSADEGKSFAGVGLEDGNSDTCPMSSMFIAEGPKGVYGCWDINGQISFGRIQRDLPGPDGIFTAPGTGGNRKHPVMAFNKNGDMILVWTEGTGWMRGGTLAWQVYDKNFKARESGRRTGAIPVWGLPAVVAEADGRFTIFH